MKENGFNQANNGEIINMIFELQKELQGVYQQIAECSKAAIQENKAMKSALLRSEQIIGEQNHVIQQLQTLIKKMGNVIDGKSIALQKESLKDLFGELENKMQPKNKLSEIQKDAIWLYNNAVLLWNAKYDAKKREVSAETINFNSKSCAINPMIQCLKQKNIDTGKNFSKEEVLEVVKHVYDTYAVQFSGFDVPFRHTKLMEKYNAMQLASKSKQFGTNGKTISNSKNDRPHDF